LPERAEHGVRKIAAETVAESGAPEKQIMGVFGLTKAHLAAATLARSAGRR